MNKKIDNSQNRSFCVGLNREKEEESTYFVNGAFQNTKKKNSEVVLVISQKQSEGPREKTLRYRPQRLNNCCQCLEHLDMFYVGCIFEDAAIKVGPN